MVLIRMLTRLFACVRVISTSINTIITHMSTYIIFNKKVRFVNNFRMNGMIGRSHMYLDKILQKYKWHALGTFTIFLIVLSK